MDLEGKKPAPCIPIYSGEVHRSFTLAPGAALSLPNTSSSVVVLGEALPENCKLHHHAVVLPELSLNFSSPLAGSRRRICPRAVRVLNAEVLSVRHQIIGDLNHDEYDSINPVLLNASA